MFYLSLIAMPTSETSGGSSIGIVSLRTKATEFSLYDKFLVKVLLKVGVSSRWCYRLSSFVVLREPDEQFCSVSVVQFR
jgi:hypothetical protein